MDNARKDLTAGLVAVAVAVVLTGCSGAATKEASSSVASSPVASSSAPTSTSVASAAAHNQADAMFAAHMVPHHRQAVEMSDLILGKQGIDPRVVELAKQIKAAQDPEIEMMQGWLSQWGVPAMPGMGGMPGHGGMNGSGSPGMMPGMTGMPGMDDMPGMGMMSTADMDALKNADGVQASKLFLTQMIQHHQGAITVAQDEIKNGEFPDAIALSKSIVASQQKEIDTMNQILGTL